MISTTETSAWCCSFSDGFGDVREIEPAKKAWGSLQAVLRAGFADINKIRHFYSILVKMSMNEREASFDSLNKACSLTH